MKRHDLGPLDTKDVDIADIIKAVRSVMDVTYAPPQDQGYSDAQLIQEECKIPAINMGPIGADWHKPGEWVDIPSLDKVQAIYTNIIRAYCKTS